jgi:predicted Zn-dependent protease
MSKRLAMLEKITASESADSFAWYGLAMEYRKEGRHDDALAAFEKLRARDPDYLPMFLMAGQLLLEMQRPVQAKDWLTRGLELARKQGNDKTQSELQSALAETEAQQV